MNPCMTYHVTETQNLLHYKGLKSQEQYEILDQFHLMLFHLKPIHMTTIFSRQLAN